MFKWRSLIADLDTFRKESPRLTTENVMNNIVQYSIFKVLLVVIKILMMNTVEKLTQSDIGIQS